PVERRQGDDAVVAREDTREPRLELLAANRREEPDTPEVDADHGDAGAKEALERTQHRPVAAEYDGDVGRREILLRLAVPVLRDLLTREEELDARIARHFLEALERRADRPTLAVRHDRYAADGVSRLRLRFARRCHREVARALCGRGGGTPPGFLSVRANRSLRPPPSRLPTRAQPPQPRERHACARRRRERHRPSVPRGGRPRTAASRARRPPTLHGQAQARAEAQGER